MRKQGVKRIWRALRLRRNRKYSALEATCSRVCEIPGKYRALVKVVDIFGNDANKLVEIKVWRLIQRLGK